MGYPPYPLKLLGKCEAGVPYSFQPERNFNFPFVMVYAAIFARVKFGVSAVAVHHPDRRLAAPRGVTDKQTPLLRRARMDVELAGRP